MHLSPLQKLTLVGCSVSTLSILASSQLQQLTVMGDTWPTGWASAAKLWPNLSTVTWHHCTSHDDYDKLLNDIITSAVSKKQIAFKTPEGASVSPHKMIDMLQSVAPKHPAIAELQDLCLGFLKFRCLTVDGFPCMLTIEDLSPVLHQLTSLTCIRMSINNWDCTDRSCWTLRNQLLQHLPYATVCIVARD